MKKEVKLAKGVRGFLLYNPYTEKHFFRVYESEDKKTFTDYDLAAEDIEVELTCDYNCLVKYEDGKNKVDFTCSHKKD